MTGRSRAAAKGKPRGARGASGAAKRTSGRSVRASAGSAAGTSARADGSRGVSGASRHHTPMELTRPVFFIGFMGAGKTSVSRRLARTCGVASVDMDTYLERCAGKRVKEIFAEVGEEGFRAMETEVLEELATSAEPMLVSCGGGVILREENRAILAERGFVVYLQVTADEAASRISDISTRPLFQNLEAARARNDERRPLYEGAANITVNTAGKSVNAIAWEVSRLLEKEGILCQRRRWW